MSLVYSNVIWKQIKMETWGESCPVRTHPSAHTASPAQHMCVRFLHSLAHTYIRTPNEPYAHTQTHAHRQQICARQMRAQICTQNMHWAQHPTPSLKHTHTHKEKRTSFHCKSLRAPAGPDSANPICYNNCRTGRGPECFWSWSV